MRANNDLGSHRHSVVTVSTPDFVTCSGCNAEHADSESSSSNRSMLHIIKQSQSAVTAKEINPQSKQNFRVIGGICTSWFASIFCLKEPMHSVANYYKLLPETNHKLPEYNLTIHQRESCETFWQKELGRLLHFCGS